MLAAADIDISEAVARGKVFTAVSLMYLRIWSESSHAIIRDESPVRGAQRNYVADRSTR